MEHEDALSLYTRHNFLAVGGCFRRDAANLWRAYERDSTPIRVTYYYIMYHVIECYLKAALMAGGVSGDEIRSFGHKLTEMLNKNEGRVGPYTKKTRSIVEHLDSSSRGQLIRYGWLLNVNRACPEHDAVEDAATEILLTARRSQVRR